METSEMKLSRLGLVATASLLLVAATPIGRMSEDTIAADGRPVYIAASSSGAWLTDPQNSALWFVSRDGREVLKYGLGPTDSEPFSIASTARTSDDASRRQSDDPWLTEFGSGKLATVGRDGTLQELAKFQIAQSELTMPIGLKPPLITSISPLDVIVGPDGALWFTEPAHHRIGSYIGGKLTQYRATTTGAPLMIASGPHGVLWFTETISGRIAMFQNGLFQEFAAPDAGAGPISLAQGSLIEKVMPARIAVAGDGTVYFTQNWAIASCDSRIGELDSSGKIRYLQMPTSRAGAADVTIGPDGRLWFTEYCGNKLGHVLPSGKIEEFEVPTPNSGPLGIAATRDRALFAEHKTGKLGVFDWGIIVPSHGDPATAYK
jgi:streptogramin lyase